MYSHWGISPTSWRSGPPWSAGTWSRGACSSSRWAAWARCGGPRSWSPTSSRRPWAPRSTSRTYASRDRTCASRGTWPRPPDFHPHREIGRWGRPCRRGSWPSWSILICSSLQSTSCSNVIAGSAIIHNLIYKMRKYLIFICLPKYLFGLGICRRNFAEEPSMMWPRQKNLLYLQPWSNCHCFWSVMFIFVVRVF